MVSSPTVEKGLNVKNGDSPDFESIKVERRRLTILRTLFADSTASASMMLPRDWLPRLGLGASTDVVCADLRMLDLIGLVVFKDGFDFSLRFIFSVVCRHV